MIAQYVDVGDVGTAFDLARHDLAIAVRGGGHNPAGHCVLGAGLVIDLSRMRRVDVDRETRVARAQGGSTCADFDAAAQAAGLVTQGGVVGSTGVCRLTLGGGVGHLTAHGLSCDNLIGAEIVTPAAEVIIAASDENAERSGGSTAAAATSVSKQDWPSGSIRSIAWSAGC